MTPTTAEKAKQLYAQVHSFQLHHWKRHKKYGNAASCVVVLGLLLSGATTATAFLGNGAVAGVLGIATTLFIGLHDAFNFSEKATFYREIHAEAKTIRDVLHYQVETGEEFKAAFDSFQTLRLKAEKSPGGKGIAVLKRDTNGALGAPD